jgi:hypothetical protein
MGNATADMDTATRAARAVHHAAALARFAAMCNSSPSEWLEVGRPKDLRWYEWYDLATDTFGLCRLSSGCAWEFPPGGDDPVVLEWVGRGQPDDRFR